MDKIKFILIFLHIFYFIETYCQTTIEPRGWPGCSLINTKIYCFGGFKIDTANNHYTSINDHISLDLSPFKNTTTFNKSDIQWKNVSNIIDNKLTLQSRGIVSTIPIYSEKSYLIYGGFSDEPYISSSSMSELFAEYKIDEDEWKSIDVQKSSYTSSSAVINLGNDTIWVWGGRRSSSNITANVVNIYDYHSNSWSKPIRYRWSMRSQFTATLAHDGYIYIMGGYYYQFNKNNDVNFQNVLRFNINTSIWSNITATGNIPTNRIHHTTTEISGTDLLLIYGGINTLSGLPSNDSYYLYDIVHNNFTAVQVNNTRYAHFATVFDSSYLIFTFGYISTTTPADSLNILNVKDPFNPVFLLGDSINTTTTESSDDPNNEDQVHSRQKMNSATVAAIVVPIVIVTVLGIMGSVYYILYKARKSEPKRNSVGFQGLQAELGQLRNSMLMDQAEFDEMNEKMYLYPQVTQMNNNDPQSSHIKDDPESSQIKDDSQSDHIKENSQPDEIYHELHTSFNLSEQTKTNR